MDPKIINLIMENMDTFEKHLHKMVEKIIEDKLREKLDIIGNYEMEYLKNILM